MSDYGTTVNNLKLKKRYHNITPVFPDKTEEKNVVWQILPRSFINLLNQVFLLES